MEERKENGQGSAPWLDLPRDLLLNIVHRLSGRIGCLRQHSVCSPWRGSSLPHEPRFPPRLLHGSSGRYLSRRTVFALSPPPRHRSPASSDDSQLTSSWLIKLEDQTSPGKMRVCYPLRGEYVLGPLPSVFPPKIDLLEVGVVELGHEYIFWSYDASFNLAVESIHRDKLAFCYLGKNDDFVVLAIEFPGRLLSLYRSEDEGMHKRIAYDETQRFSDLIAFQGMFYAVDSHGMTHVIRPESMEVIQTVASKVELCGDTKRLVECGGELLLVDICIKQACCGSDQRIRFRLFKLHRNQKVWVNTSSVGDHVVFLGGKSSFSAPALTLGGRGNRIVYEWVDLEPAMDRVDGSCGLMTGDDVLGCGFIKVFDVGSGCLEDLSEVPELMRLFWPPPSWIPTSRVIPFQDLGAI